MKTETEKAIEFIKDIIPGGVVNGKLYSKQMDSVITLLQQGEKLKKQKILSELLVDKNIVELKKYKAMWNIYKNKIAFFKTSKEMKEFEKIYFPEEATQ